MLLPPTPPRPPAAVRTHCARASAEETTTRTTGSSRFVLAAPPLKSSRPDYSEKALKVATNQTDHPTSSPLLCRSLCPSSVLCVLPGKKSNIRDALNRIYIYIYIMTAVGEYLIPQRFRLELCPNCSTKQNGGNSFCGTPKCGNSARLRLKSSTVVLVTALQLFGSLCEFVLEDVFIGSLSCSFSCQRESISSLDVAIPKLNSFVFI